MSTKTEDPDMLAQPVSEWTFDFWKQQVEDAPDIPGAVGRLGACIDLPWQEGADKKLVYLMEVADARRVSDPRSAALAGKARQVIARLLERDISTWQYDNFRHVRIDILEKALWFFRPDEAGTGFINEFRDSVEADKIIRRLRGNLCWSLWEGRMKDATLAHKIQALDIIYMMGRLSELLPIESPLAQGASLQKWYYFKDVLPHLEEMARKEIEFHPRSTLKTVEESAYFGKPASCILILVRTVLSAAESFHERLELENLREKTPA
ncbi:MAG: hypothetical protein V4682_01735 [Patescibacteria group bacterium]